ncbi:MAG: hypothetical protein J5598_00185, partial [Clostridia bacterium]|nr:hypothetical protein [Clostridia bacterium]
MADLSETAKKFVFRLDSDFSYKIMRREIEEIIPPLPSGPHSRTEVQAIGTTANYTIDLDQMLSMDIDLLSYNEQKLKARGWKASFVDKVFTLSLLSDDVQNEINNSAAVNTAVDKLLNEDIVFNFYSGTRLEYVLTIQPVLFEVVGIGTTHPEKPVYLANGNIADLEYRAIVKYNPNITYQDENAGRKNVANSIADFNQQLNAAKNDLFEIEQIEENNRKYLKLTIAVDYGLAGSAKRIIPMLLDIEKNQGNKVESFVEYVLDDTNSNAAKYYQPIGTTEYYYLGASLNNSAAVTVSIDGVQESEITNYVPTAELVSNSEGVFELKVILTGDENLVTNLVSKQIVITVDGFTVTIQPVWFLVEGFEVVGHPERPIRLIVSDTNNEKVSSLKYNVRAQYAVNVAENVASLIKGQIAIFNNNLIGNEWSGYLDLETIGAQYLVVRAAVKYSNSGVASIVNKDNSADYDEIVSDKFEYHCYKKVQPAIPVYTRAPGRTVEIAVGYNATYTIDIPNLGTISSNLIALYENNNAENADEDNKLTPVTDNSNWQVEVLPDNRLRITLNGTSDAAKYLIQRELKVFIYYNEAHSTDAPNSYDTNNVAFVLTIRPVLFKVVGFTLEGQVDDVIYVDNIDTFTAGITRINGDTFVPVYQYNDSLLATEFETAENKTLKTIIDDFTSNFKTSSYLSKTCVGAGNNVYYFRVITSVGYQPYQGLAYLTNETLYRIEKNFKVVVVPNPSQVVERTEYQALGTKKTYHLDDSILTIENGVVVMDTMFGGSNYTWVENDNMVTITSVESNLFSATWNKNNPNYLEVELKSAANILTPIDLKISDKANHNFTLHIKPVYFEILGFEVVNHPERAVLIIEPETLENLQYRVITTDLAGVPGGDLSTVQSYINTLNIRLNNGEASKAIKIEDDQYIIFDAAVNYNAEGYPEFVTITSDRRNVVESIIDFRINRLIPTPPEDPSIMGKAQFNQVIGKTKLYTLDKIKGQFFYQYLTVENGGNLVAPFGNSIDGKTVVYEKLTIKINTVRNTMQVQLKPDESLRTNIIRVYIPYTRTVEGKEVWYCYCLEITPLLYELKGWTIAGNGENSPLVAIEGYDDRLYIPL